MGFIGLWNILVSFAGISFGIGILKLRKWGYDWGLGTAIINVFSVGYTYFFTSNSLLFLFLLIAELATAIMLYENRKQFHIKVIRIRI
jgi:hypothetical protein